MHGATPWGGTPQWDHFDLGSLGGIDPQPLWEEAFPTEMFSRCPLFYRHCAKGRLDVNEHNGPGPAPWLLTSSGIGPLSLEERSSALEGFVPGVG